MNERLVLNREKMFNENGERIEKDKQAERKEYLDILATISDDFEDNSDSDLGEDSIKIVIDAAGVDASDYEKKLNKMQAAAKILDAEMASRRAEISYYDWLVKAAEVQDDHEEYESILSNRDRSYKRMQEAHNLAQEELRKAYPSLDDREASKKFFGYESWAVDRSELFTSTRTKEDYGHDTHTLDADGNVISSEEKPDDPERFALINKAIQFRYNTHSNVYSDKLDSEVGVFRPAEI